MTEQLPSPPHTPTESHPLFTSTSHMSQNINQHPNHISGPFSGDRSSSSSEGHQSTTSSQPFGHASSRESHSGVSQGSGYPQSTSERPLMNQHHRASSNFDDLTPEILGLSSPHSGSIGQAYSRYSSVPSRHSMSGLAGLARDDESEDLEYGQQRGSFYSPGNRSSVASFTQGDMVRAATTDALLWDEKNMEGDDYLHNPDPSDEPKRHYRNSMNGAGAIALPVVRSDQIPAKQSGTFGYSKRGLINFLGLFVVVGGLVGVFAFWPIATYVQEIRNPKNTYGWNLGGTNSSGQVPEIPGFPALIDSDTPEEVRNRKRVGYDGRDYRLVFSDEFNRDSRTFHEGDDPFWEAVSLNYWATVNYEWVDPDAVITRDGSMQITMTEQPINGCNFRSGFVQSWNKFCVYKGAYIEMNVSLPGRGDVIGLWPGLWTMGNLGRAGFGATNDGMWPYSYDECDVGTQPNQTNTDNATPAAARNSGERDYGGSLSYLPGQRLSACTCPGDDHPGPRGVGRGAPEIDILEAQVDYHGYGTASQSMQIAPFDAAYAWINDSTGYINHRTEEEVSLNQWKGSITQESASAVTRLDNVSYGGRQYQTFGFEYWGGSGPDAYVTWYVGGRPTWTLTGDAFPPNAAAEIGARLISEEPMYLMMNLFISSKFQGMPNFGMLEFPTTMYIDYVRVWQRESDISVGCDPKDHPTAKYIQDHLGAYTNINYTTWEQAGYQWPRNSREEGGCDVERAGP